MVGVLLAVAAATLGGSAARFLAVQLGWERGFGFLVAGAAAGLLTYEIFSYDLLARGRVVVGAVINGLRALGHLVVVAAIGLLGLLSFGLAVGAFALAQALGAAALLLIVLREIRRPRSVAPMRATAADDPLPADLGRRPLGSLIGWCLSRGWVGQLSAVAYFLLLRVDQGLLVHFRDAAEVGIYSVAVYVGEMLWLLPGAMTPLLVHTSAGSAADPMRDRTASRAARAGFLVTGAVAIPLALLADPLLTLLAGGAYAGSASALRALLPGIVAFAPAAVLAGDFIGRGKPHWNTQASLLTVAINVAVGLVLIPRHGAVGAAWASSLAYVFGAVVMVARFRQATGLRLRTFLRRKID
jgi:O-antigen/teichoic acid export membrane protein